MANHGREPVRQQNPRGRLADPGTANRGEFLKFPVQQRDGIEGLGTRQGSRSTHHRLHAARPPGEEQGTRPLQIRIRRPLGRQSMYRGGRGIEHGLHSARLKLRADTEHADLGRGVMMGAHRGGYSCLTQTLVQPASSPRAQNRGSQVERHGVTVQRRNTLPADRQFAQGHIGPQGPTSDVATLRLGGRRVDRTGARGPVAVRGAGKVQRGFQIDVTHNADDGSLRHVARPVIPHDIIPGKPGQVLLTPDAPAPHPVPVVHGFVEGFLGQRGGSVQLSSGFLDDDAEFPAQLIRVDESVPQRVGLNVDRRPEARGR
jgi:hypothetical protein